MQLDSGGTNNNSKTRRAAKAQPWEGQGDPLGRALFAASGGRARFLPYQMNGLRRSGLPDDEVTKEFRVFLDRNPQAGRAWKSVYYRFRNHLLLLAADLRAAAAKNSCSEESHGRNTHQSHTSDHPSRIHTTPTSRTDATQVFDFSPEKTARSDATIPAALSRERSSSATAVEKNRRGSPPSKPSPVNLTTVRRQP